MVMVRRVDVRELVEDGQKDLLVIAGGIPLKRIGQSVHATTLL